MSGRGDDNKSGSAGRGGSTQSGQVKNQAEKQIRHKQDQKPGRTSNQGRKESSGGESGSPERNS